MILRQLPSAHFVIAGAAIYQAHREYEGELKRLVKASGLEDRVHFLGYRQDVPGLLATFDAFVLPSRSEGFGRAVAEAQAVGCPVVASDVGGVSEIVSDGETGLLVQPNEPESLARAVVRLAKDQLLRDRLIEEARRSVRRRFGLDRQVKLLESAVMSVIEGRPFDPASRADVGETGRRSHLRRGIGRLPAFLRGIGGASVRKSLRPSPSSGTQHRSASHSGH
jgi:glycosyltransferase involved in cell wall biosynthesis